ncbi:MAG: hypothetical protein WAN86_25675, partial [Hyphomicrobiaceae bacterium]
TALLGRATTDRMALSGVLIAMSGVAMFSYAFSAWVQEDFGPLADPMIPRMVLGGMTMIVNGMQVFFTGLVLGILGIPKRERTQ